MPYPFYETLEYPHQFRQARKEAKLAKRFKRDMRKERRRARKVIVKGNSYNLPKPGRWVGRNYQSSGVYRRSYDCARSEADYYDHADY